MKNILILIITGLVFSISSAFAQVGEVEDVLLRQAGKDGKKQLLKEMSQKEISALQSMQVGGNYNGVVQTGNGNAALIQQIGMGNVVDLVQHGHNNVYDGEIIGNNNLNAVEQQGNDNTIVQRVNADGYVHKITQSGNNLRLDHTENRATNQQTPLEIKQRGNDMQVSITNGGMGAIPITVK